MPLAWIDPPGFVRDVAQDPDPFLIYAPEIATLYDTEVPEGTVNGATLVNDVWVNPPPYVPPEPPPVVEPVPFSISRLQLILGMTQAGLISASEGVAAAAGMAIPAAVEAVFATLPNGQGTTARIRWNAMTDVERANPLVAAVAAAAGKTSAEMDQYFRDWSAL
jgi:hypothetical protein